MKQRARRRPAASRLGLLPLWMLILLVPLVFWSGIEESFRVPKLLLAECLTLASLALLSLRLRRVERVSWRQLSRQPVVLAVVPVLVVATVGLATSDHPLHVRRALVSLWIGVAGLVGWSLALTPREHRRLLNGLMVPALALSVLAILQFHDLFNPFEFERRVSERIGLTSLAGGAFDLAAFLTLPCLLAQAGWFHETVRRRRWAWGLGFGVCCYAVVATQTLAALLALFAGSLVLWLVLLPRRRFAGIAALVALAGLAVALAVTPLRHRLERKLESFERGDLNRVVTGRLDGWRAALWMVGEKPWTGVGHGAYRPEYGHARLALRREGVKFYGSQNRAYFVNAHSDVLEALAEWGIPGGVALVWGLLVLARAQRRLSAVGEPADVALAGAGLTALSILASINFSMRLAITAYPALLFLAWFFAASRKAER